MKLFDLGVSAFTCKPVNETELAAEKSFVVCPPDGISGVDDVVTDSLTG